MGFLALNSLSLLIRMSFCLLIKGGHLSPGIFISWFQVDRSIRVFLLYWPFLQFSSVRSLSCVQLFATPWIAARQASLSITNSRSSLRLTSIESVMPSSHLILCCPLLLLSPIPPRIRVFSNESNAIWGHNLGQPTFGTQQDAKPKYQLPYLQVCISLIIPPITLLIDVHDLCVCVCVCSVAQSCLCDLPGSSVHGIF